MGVCKSVKNLLFVSVCICSLLTVTFQAGAQSKIEFKGRILDSETNKPLSFVSIGIPKSGSGVISNEFGEFNYHVPENFEYENIQISIIGYKKVTINASELKPETLITIRLNTEIQMLNEVTVWVTPAADIVGRAIQNIRKNYPKKTALFYGYYRDYLKEKGSNDYKNLLEAAVVIEDRGFNNEDFEQSKIKLEQIRFNPGFIADTLLNPDYDGKIKRVPYTKMKASNELALLRFQDPIRNHSREVFSWVYVFDYDFVPEHNFRFESIIADDTSKIFVINFDKNISRFSDSTTREYWVDGKIYIRSKDYAILKFNYTVTCKLPGYSGKFFDLKLEYKDFEGKYYLNYLSVCNYFEYKNDTASNPLQYYQYRELFINKIVNDHFKSLKKREIINIRSPLMKNEVPVQKGFWENYNYTSNLKLLE
jgi:hypothetical protein